jgi:hypothetical protein
LDPEQCHQEGIVSVSVIMINGHCATGEISRNWRKILFLREVTVIGSHKQIKKNEEEHIINDNDFQSRNGDLRSTDAPRKGKERKKRVINITVDRMRYIS